MDLAELKLDISVESRDAEASLDRATKRLNALAEAADKAASKNMRSGIFNDAVVKHLGLLSTAAKNSGAHTKRLGDMAKNLKPLGTAAKDLQSFASANVQTAKDIIPTARGIDDLGARVEYLKRMEAELKNTINLTNAALDENGILSKENRARIIDLTKATASDSVTAKRHKKDILERANALTDSTDETKRQVLALQAEEAAIKQARVELQGYIQEQKKLGKGTPTLGTPEWDIEFEKKLKEGAREDDIAAGFAHQNKLAAMNADRTKLEQMQEQEAQRFKRLETKRTNQDIIAENDEYYRWKDAQNTQAMSNELAAQALLDAQDQKSKQEAIAREKELERTARLVNKAYMARMNALRDVAMLARQTGMALTRYLTTPLVAAAAVGVKFTAEMELQQKAFEILLGDATAAVRLYGEVVEYAARTPYQLPELTQATKELLAFGSASGDVMDEMRRLGDIAQNDAQKLDSVVKAFGKVQARGVAHMRELNRFIMAGVPIISELGKVMNMASEELFSGVQKGLVSFDAVKQAIENLTDEGGRFYNMSIEMSQLVAGRWSTLQDEFHLMLRSFVEDLMPTILQGINYVIDFFEAIRNMSREQRQAIRTTLMWVAAIGPLLLLFSKAVTLLYTMEKLFKSIGLAIKAIEGVKTIGAIGSAILAGLGGIPLVITAIITALAAWAAWSGFSKLKSNMNGIVNDFRDLRSELDSIAELESPDEIFDVINLRFNTTGGIKVFDQDIFDAYLASVEEPDWDKFLVTLDIREKAANTILGAGERYAKLMQTAVEKLQKNIEKPINMQNAEQRQTLLDILHKYVFNPKEKQALDAAVDDFNRGNTEALILLLQSGAKGLFAGIGAGTIVLDDDTKRKLGRIGDTIAAEGLEAVVESALRTLSREPAQKAPIDNLMKVFSKTLLQTTDVSGFEGLGSNANMITAMLESYVSDTIEAIDNAGARLTKYMGEVPGFSKILDVLYAKPKQGELFVTTTFAQRMEGIYGSMTPDEQAFYKILEPFFGDEVTIRKFFTSYEKLITKSAQEFVDSLRMDYFIENIAGQLAGDGLNPESKKSYAEHMIKGIEEQISSFVKSKSPQTLLELQTVLDEFEKLNPDVLKEYTANLNALKDLSPAVEAIKQLDKGISDYEEKLLAIGRSERGAFRKQVDLWYWNAVAIAENSAEVKELEAKAKKLKQVWDDVTVGAEQQTLSQDILQSALSGTVGAYDALILKMQEFAPETEENILALRRMVQAVQGLHSIINADIGPSIGGRQVKDIASDFATPYADMSSEYKGSYTESQYQADKVKATKAIYKELAKMDYPTRMATETTTAFEDMTKAMEDNLGATTYSITKQQGLAEGYTDMNKDIRQQIELFGKSERKIQLMAARQDLKNMTDKESIATMEEYIKSLQTLTAKEILGGLGSDLLQQGLNGVVDSLVAMGEAFATGADGAKTFSETMSQMFLEMVHNMPTLFLNAGLMAISMGNWGLGVPLLVMSGVTAVASGYIKGQEAGAQTDTQLAPSSLTFSAKGNIHKNGNIISAPTAFKTKSGWNIGGEAGNEAILPLGRTSEGKLGVMGSTGGGNVSVAVNVEVINQTGVNVETETETTTGPNGEQNIRMIIKKVVAEGMGKGEYDRVMGSRYGVKHRGVM